MSGMDKLKTAGWREWGDLPELGIRQIKMKMDTGARTSCLHTFHIEEFENQGQPWLRFKVHPIQGDDDTVVECEAPVHDVRTVTDSGGHREKRFVIVTQLSLGGETWPVEMTLTNRDTMKFRMLVGRTAMNKRLVINPSLSFAFGKEPKV